MFSVKTKPVLENGPAPPKSDTRFPTRHFDTAAWTVRVDGRRRRRSQHHVKPKWNGGRSGHRSHSLKTTTSAQINLHLNLLRVANFVQNKSVNTTKQKIVVMQVHVEMLDCVCLQPSHHWLYTKSTDGSQLTCSLEKKIPTNGHFPW